MNLGGPLAVNGLGAGQPVGEANQDRREVHQRRSLFCLQDGGDRDSEKPLYLLPAAIAGLRPPPDPATE